MDYSNGDDGRFGAGPADDPYKTAYAKVFSPVDMGAARRNAATVQNKAKAWELFGMVNRYTQGYAVRKFGSAWESLPPGMRVLLRVLAFFVTDIEKSRDDFKSMYVSALSKLEEARTAFAKEQANHKDTTSKLYMAERQRDAFKLKGKLVDKFKEERDANHTALQVANDTNRHHRKRIEELEARVASSAVTSFGVDYGSKEGFVITVRQGDKILQTITDADCKRYREHWKIKNFAKFYGSHSQSAFEQRYRPVVTCDIESIERRASRMHGHNVPIKRTSEERALAAYNTTHCLQERHGFRWTRSEEEKLVHDYRVGRSLDHFVKMHKREWEAIVLRLAKLSGGWGQGTQSDEEHCNELKEWYFSSSNGWKPSGRSNLTWKDTKPKWTTFQHPWSTSK